MSLLDVDGDDDVRKRSSAKLANAGDFRGAATTALRGRIDRADSKGVRGKQGVCVAMDGFDEFVCEVAFDFSVRNEDDEEIEVTDAVVRYENIDTVLARGDDIRVEDDEVVIRHG